MTRDEAMALLREYTQSESLKDIEKGAALLELELDAHIGNVIAAMQKVAGDLGL